MGRLYRFSRLFAPALAAVSTVAWRSRFRTTARFPRAQPPAWFGRPSGCSWSSAVSRQAFGVIRTPLPSMVLGGRWLARPRGLRRLQTGLPAAIPLAAELADGFGPQSPRRVMFLRGMRWISRDPVFVAALGANPRGYRPRRGRTGSPRRQKPRAAWRPASSAE
jgi:hypothetical protein